MPLYLVGGILLLAALLAAVKAFVALPPAIIVRFLMWLGILVAVAVAVLLIESGRFLPVVVALGGAAPFFSRVRTVWRRWAGGGRPQGQVSQVETDYLRMSLDHETGTMTGTVRKGHFQGRRLEELDNNSLIALWREVRAEDPASVSLVESYLDRFMPDWREAARGGAGADGSGRPMPATAMTPEEALAVLGLKPGASAGEIKEAHHRLMMKIHPDQGGSDALASEVNRAKDVLLGT
jgi:hypothetical protein